MKVWLPVFTVLVLIFGLSLYVFMRPPVSVSAQVAPITPTPTDTPTDSPSPTVPTFSNGGGGQSTNSSPTPTPTTASPFNYTPLPTNRGGPENDIAESVPLTTSRPSAQVDDYIAFNTTLKNIAPYSKDLYNVCFESDDGGNLGCVFRVHLESGQEFPITNVAHWLSGGIKHVWVTWSQDNFNYYQPMHANNVVVNIVG